MVLGLTSFAQTIEKTWSFDKILDQGNQELFTIDRYKDTLSLANGKFNYTLNAKNDLKASGNYLYQNNILVLYYDQPQDTIRHYRITELTDSTLVFNESGVSYKFIPKQSKTTVAPDAIIKSKGF